MSNLPKRFSFLRSWQIVLGGTAISLLMIVAIFAPLIAPYDIAEQDLMSTLLPPGSPGHLLGTDELGRDILSRLIHGSRVSLMTGLMAAAISICVGVPLGLLAGYFSGRADMMLGRFFDAVLAIPSILLAIGLSSIFGPGLMVIIVALGLVWWATYARMVRSEALALASMDFVEAAKATGCSNSRVVFRYLLPNVLPIVLALLPLTIASGILVEASLSFLGIGVRPPTPTWGAMLATGRNFIRTSSFMATMPGLCIAVTILSLNLLGDGLRDYLDPKLKR